MLAKLEEEWFGWEYDMLSHNCVNFATVLCREIGMGPIPRWCGRVARIGAKIKGAGANNDD